MARERNPKPREEHEIEFSRIVAFSDGVFAIAITLLVLALEVPEHIHSSNALAEALWDEREKFLAFAISFAVIGRFWLVHHRFFGDVKAFDGRLLVLNLFYLAWIVLIPFSTELLGEYGGKTTAIVLYSANLAGVILTSLWMAADAQKAGLTETDAFTHRENRIRSCYIAGVFLLSIPLAFAVPDKAPLLWLVLFYDPALGLARRFSASR